MSENKIPDEAKKVFVGEIFDVYQWEQELYDGSITTYEMLKRADTVQVLAIVEGKLVILIDEQPFRGKKLCFPAGKVEPGEDWLTAAKRETKEEAGMTFADWRLIYVEDNIPRMEYASVFFVAQNLVSRGEQTPDPGEKIEVTLREFAEVKDIVMNNVDEHLRFAKPIFEQIDSLQQIIDLPEHK
ncbi:hypothetical protein A3F37_04355 [Candidatus Saccharibacteria bacterium RIFCSPHIGHO2_12_FULL_41_12]|nr:MAG: hypothetical protein A3F37_04355 [Candidatus Saccharibacteria bacterium RIFCSPHIGHO2_12_FULL_41_12]